MPLKAERIITKAAVITETPTIEIRLISVTMLFFLVERRYRSAMYNGTLIGFTF